MLQSIVLPFAIVPLLHFCSSEQIMGEFVISRWGFIVLLLAHCCISWHGWVGRFIKSVFNIVFYSDHLSIYSLFRFVQAFLWLVSACIIVINIIIVAQSVFSSTEGKPSVMFYTFVGVLSGLYIGKRRHVFVCIHRIASPQSPKRSISLLLPPLAQLLLYISV